MTTNQIKNITQILTEEMGDCVGHYEINNTISVMKKTDFGNDGAVNAEKLKTACNDARKYLESITRPLNMMAMEAIFKNKVFIAVARIEETIK